MREIAGPEVPGSKGMDRVAKNVDEARVPSRQPRSPRPQGLAWSGYALCVWSTAYALPHVYWALGGTAGMMLLKPSVYGLPQWEAINWAASVILIAAGVLGIAFVHFKERGFSSVLLLALALAGCAVSTAHGLYGIIYRIAQVAGGVEVEWGPFRANEHAYVLWDLVLFEPWFMIEGFLLGAVGWRYLDSPRSKRTWLTLCTLGTIVGLLTGLFGVRFA